MGSTVLLGRGTRRPEAVRLHSWERRAAGHAAACRAVLATELSSAAHRRACAAHARFVAETLAELAGFRHPVAQVSSGHGATRPEDEAARGSGPPGTLFVSVHRGNWIVGARALDSAPPVHTVAGTQLHPWLDRFVVRWLARRGVRVLPASTPLVALDAILRAGGRVLLHLDGDPHAPGTRAWRMREVPAGVRSAAVLAARSGARVEGVVCERGADGKFRLRRRELASPLEPEDAGRASRVERWERTLHGFLRAVVAADPSRWMIFRHAHLGCSSSQDARARRDPFGGAGKGVAPR